jgi:hypothetical protein
LWPFSQGELRGVSEDFVDAVFATGPLQARGAFAGRGEVLESGLQGGFPEMLRRSSPRGRDTWFRSYVTTLLQRDVTDLAAIEGGTMLPRLLSLLAAQSTGLLNCSDLSRRSAIPQTTLKRYLGLLQATFLVHLLPAWSANLGKRLVKAPRLMLLDSGLMAHLQGFRRERLTASPGLFGPLLENLVATELLKQVQWSQTRPSLFHYRTLAGEEVDLLLEDSAGRLVGLEVKGSASVDAHDFRGLKALATAAGERFLRGLVLYTGTDCLPFGTQFQAVPISGLWHRWR